MTPQPDELLFLPLGGSGEIGMNATLYGHDGGWIIVDLGITFGNEKFPDYDVMMADTAFIEQRSDELRGIVLTHGHEDHIGALPYLWQRLRCPVYATPFTAALVMQKLARAGVAGVPLIERQTGERFAVGPFDIEYIGMTHSIPEPQMLLIGSPAGQVLHTGDWKLDRAPVIGQHFDRARLRRLRQERLAAVVCDSTNAVVQGSTGSEGDLFQPLLQSVTDAPGRVVVTTFASNVARLVTLARVAQASGRRFGVIGAAMQRMLAIARGSGYWPDDLPQLVEGQHLGYLPRQEVLAACTGSQGEPRSALARMATASHRDLLLEPGDRVLFSSRLIPGNETAVHGLQQRLRDLGMEVITDEDANIHVSGHPASDDLRQLYDWIAPDTVIPVHGTPRHQLANARIAAACGASTTCVPANGELYRLGRHGGATRIGLVENGRLTVVADGQLEAVPADALARMRGGAC
jgi:ribonuclease J